MAALAPVVVGSEKLEHALSIIIQRQTAKPDPKTLFQCCLLLTQGFDDASVAGRLTKPDIESSLLQLLAEHAADVDLCGAVMLLLSKYWLARELKSPDSAATAPAAAVRGIATALQRHIANSSTASAGCEALWRVGPYRAAAAVMTAGVPRLLVAAAERHADNLAVVLYACGAMCDLSMPAEPAAALIKAGALRVFKSALERFAAAGSEPEDARRLADVICGALAHMSGSEAMRPKLFAEGAPELLIAALRRCPEHAFVAQRGCGTLYGLCMDPSFLLLPIAAGAVEAVSAALKLHSSDRGVAFPASALLWNICCVDAAVFGSAPSGVQRLIAAGGVDLAAQVMQTHVADGEIVENCCGIIERVASELQLDESRVRSFPWPVNLGDALAGALQAHGSTHETFSLLLAVAHLVTRGSMGAIARPCHFPDTFCQTLVSTVRRYMSSEELVGRTMQTLFLLGDAGPGADGGALAERYGPAAWAVAVAALRKYPRDATVVHACYGLLHMLVAEQPSLAGNLVAAGVAAPLLQCLRARTAHPSVQPVASALLAALAVNKDTRLALLEADAGAIDVIVATIRSGVEMQSRLFACSTVARLAATDNETVGRFVTAGAAAALGDLLRAGARHPFVTAELFMALRTLAAAPLGRERLLAAGAPEALAPWVVDFMPLRLPEAATAVVCGAIRNLAILPAARARLVAAGCVQPLVLTLGLTSENLAHPAVWPVCGAVYALACDPGCRAALREEDAVEMLVLALRNRIDDWRVCWAACGALMHLATTADGGRLPGEVDTSNACGVLGAVLEAHAGERRVIRAAKAALARLSR